MNCFLRWAGSKRKLIPHLAEYWTDTFDRYVEPFMGSACLFFSLEPKVAMLGDTNQELISAFTTIRAQPERVHALLTGFPIGEETYYRLRDEPPPASDHLYRAARFVYLNRFCFNGIYRTNRRGQFNVPFGGDRSGALPTLAQLIEASALLRRATIHSGDFETTLSGCAAGDFVYLDPPYSVANRRIFKQYGPSVFGIDDLKRLSLMLPQLDARGVKFVLSYASCSEAREFFGRWSKQCRMTTRNVSGFAKHRRKAVELLFSNIR